MLAGLAGQSLAVASDIADGPEGPNRTISPAEEMLSDLQRRCPSVGPACAGEITGTLLVGHYSKGPGLAGAELFLFSDGTYIYTVWADISPETMHDIGRWRVVDGFVKLTSDKSVRRSRVREPYDRFFLPFRLGDKEDIYVMGNGENYAFFINEGKDHPKWTLEFVALHRVETPSEEEEKTIRDQLMTLPFWSPGLDH